MGASHSGVIYNLFALHRTIPTFPIRHSLLLIWTWVSLVLLFLVPASSRPALRIIVFNSDHRSTYAVDLALHTTRYALMGGGTHTVRWC